MRGHSYKKIVLNGILFILEEHIMIVNDRGEDKPLATLFRILALIAIFLGIGLYLNVTNDKQNENNILVNEPGSAPAVDESLSEELQNGNTKLEIPKEGIASLIGKNINELESHLGSPNRIDPSLYGYDWWIYNKKENQYIQVGVLNNKIATLYAIGSDVDIAPFHIGQEVGEIYATVPIEATININYKDSSYRFELSEEDINNRPLIQMGEIFVQLYIDKFTGTLSSVRFIDVPTLIKLRPYELVYRGELFKVESEGMDEEEIDRGSEKQIYDISNVMRARFGLPLLEWDDKTASVALGHSKDMYESKQFSHTSEKFGELSDRLDAGEVFYQAAGENIAAHYIDAPAVVEGWLNSKGHRESLLNKDFTHIGIGVYKKYYTQNFIQKW